ncbi:MAG: AzlC family ABC transporter permease [Pseudomonadota bacterium]
MDSADVRAGARGIAPLAIGVALYGVAFGVLAAEAGFSPLGIGVMALAVFAGASQIAAVDQFLTTGSVLGAALAGAALNLRYVGITASVAPALRDLPVLPRAFALWGATDENLGLTVTRPAAGRGGYLLGTCLVLIPTWAASTVLGAVIGAAIPDLDRFGVSFAFTAAFIAMARGLWPGVGALLPWGLTFAVTWGLVSLDFPPALALVAGALSGVAVSLLQPFGTP